MVKSHSNSQEKIDKGNSNFCCMHLDSAISCGFVTVLHVLKWAECKAMFTLYQIGFCSVSSVAPVQCEQQLVFF